MMQWNFINIIQALAYYTLITNSSTPSINTDYTTIIQWSTKFITEFNRRLQNNGKTWTLKRYKSIYNWVKAYVLGVHNVDQLLDPFIKTSKQGVPTELIPIIGLLYGESIWIRVIMTVLRIFESIKLEVTFDETSITKEYTGKPIDSIATDFETFVKQWFNKFGTKILRKLDITKLAAHEPSFRFKSGPMGPSIITSHLCALAINACPELLRWFTDYCHLTSSGELLKQFGITLELCAINGDSKISLLSGKISLAAEPAGKTRLFAICNFWVQSVLKPFHNQLMEVLKLFKTDGTFDQIGQFNRILIETKDKATFCFDLSKATDRFPILLQRLLIGVVVNSDFAEAWSNLISRFPFTYNNNSYTWIVGQPLGAFSSWAMFALTHHLVVQFCYFKVYNRIRWFNDYALLGDDIVIWDKPVAIYYQQFMNDIGVEINLTKSYIGLTNSGEFAKRHFYNGRNISGFGYQMVQQACASFTGWVRFLEILEYEDFISTGAVYFFPGHNQIGLPKKVISQLSWMWTLRNAFAHNLLLVYGNVVISHHDLIEHYVTTRLEVLYKQLSSSLSRRDYFKLINKITKISKRWGVTVKQDCLDINFINDELVSHPFIRYLNTRNNNIFDKIEYFSEITQDSLFNQSDILKLSSYAEEEYIPSLTLDTFFTEDLNEVKHRMKSSVLLKSVNRLMNSINE
jgi:hypothetical protein